MRCRRRLAARRPPRPVAPCCDLLRPGCERPVRTVLLLWCLNCRVLLEHDTRPYCRSPELLKKITVCAAKLRTVFELSFVVRSFVRRLNERTDERTNERIQTLNEATTMTTTTLRPQPSE